MEKNRIIRGPEKHLIDYVLDNLRKSDIQEIHDAYGLTPREAFRDIGIKGVSVSVAVDENGVPFMLFGSARHIDNEGHFAGIPFLVATEEISKHTRFLLSISKDELESMKPFFSYLINWIPVYSKKTIRWLSWCGFTLQPVGFCGYNKNQEFMQFTMKGGVC